MTDESVQILTDVSSVHRRREAIGIATMAMNEGLSARAARLYEKSLRANPDNDLIWSRLRHIYENLGEFAEPMRFYLDAIEREPLRPEAYRELGVFLHRADRWADAVPYLISAFLLNSQTQSVRKLLASGGLSSVSLESMCMERGRGFLHYKGNNIGFVSRLSYSFARSRARGAARADDFKAAASRYSYLLKAFPHRPETLVQYGHALKETGKTSAAEAAYRRAYALSGGDYRFALPISHVLELQGDIAAARWICAYAPDEPQAVRELERLNDIVVPGDIVEAPQPYHRINIPNALPPRAARILRAIAP